MTKRHGWARRSAGLLVVAALVGACGADEGEAGGGSGDDVVIEASPAFLSDAAERSQGASHRMAMTITLDGGEPIPMMTGEVDGDRYASTLDMGGMTTAMAEQAGQAVDPAFEQSLTMEMVGDASEQYIRSGIFAHALQLEPDAFGPAGEDLAQLGERWGRIDIEALGDAVPADVQEAVTGQGADPSAFFDLVAAAEGVEELGDDEIDGVAVTGLSAEVGFADMLESSGADPEALAESMPGGDMEQVMGAMGDMTMPLEVWVDDEGLVRRMSYELDMEELATALDIPEEELGEDDRFALGYTVDVTDYGAEDIDIRFPEGSIDVTEAFASLMES